MTHRELQGMLKQLSEYQVNQLGQIAMRYLTLNQELADIKSEHCPVCGDQNTKFIRKGLQRGKQRFQCKSCGRKFTYDTEQLTSNSQLPKEERHSTNKDGTERRKPGVPKGYKRGQFNKDGSLRKKPGPKSKSGSSVEGS